MGKVNWSPQWLASLKPVGSQVESVWSSGVLLADALNSRPGRPIQFVRQSALPPGEPYERYIFQTGNCPTRDNLHDFFNGLCWLHFPKIKRRLNQLQAEQIDFEGIQPQRGAVRDALTVFDENAAFLQCPDALWEALVAKDWQRLFGGFGGLRPLWLKSHLVLFGHALLEKLMAPRKAITAHVYRVHPNRVDPASNSINDLDAWVAQDISAQRLAAKPFAHLPVLGVPGWWAPNEDPAFYDDKAVFRAPK